MTSRTMSQGLRGALTQPSPRGVEERSMKELGVGVVGCGVISTIYMQNLAAFRGVRLVACADLLEHCARTQAERFGIRALTIEALMRDPEVDIVVNLTPPNAHFEMTHAAL